MPNVDVPAEGAITGPRPVFFTRQLVLFTGVCAAVALLPVVLDPGRELLRPAIWLGTVLLYRWLEQSVFRPSPVRGDRVAEWMFPFVYLGVTGSFLLPALEFALKPRPVSGTVLVSGLLLAGAGTLLRYRAIDTLGEQLSTHVEVRPDHRLIDHGVYRYVRHPGTTGAMIFLLGAALIMHAYYSILYIVGFLWVVLIMRMVVEERHSAERLPGYREYMTRTKRVVPFLF